MTKSSVCTERGSNITSSLGVIADWMDALHGTSDLQEVLQRLVHLVKADSAMLLRSTVANGRIRTVEQYDADAGKMLPAQCCPLLATILADNLHTAKPGSVWSLQEVQKGIEGAISLPTSRTAVKESMVITLASGASQGDFLEVQFRSEPLEHNLDLLTMLASTLVSCWQRRSPGLAEKKLVQTRMRAVKAAEPDAGIPLLDASNPAKLSRSEFRVCSMLQNGMTVKVIAETLALSEATIRCHLSSIFSKTGAACQVELLALLNADGTPRRAS